MYYMYIWVKNFQAKEAAMLLVNGKPACDPKPLELVAEMSTLCWLHAHVLLELYLSIYFIDIIIPYYSMKADDKNAR